MLSATMQESVLRKAAESSAVKQRFFEENAGRVVDLAEEMARRFGDGRKLLVMGNGGSACDAQHIAVEFLHPIFAKRKALPVIDLTGGVPLLTAISNDKDFAKVFVDQLPMWGSRGDMVLAISTSGQSPNLIYGIQAAKQLGLLTISFSGRDGGELAAISDYCFTVPSFSIHRIQESHVTLLHILWDLVHVAMGEEDVL